MAVGELSQFGPDLELRCRRAFLGVGIWGGRSVRFGGGGRHDPWARSWSATCASSATRHIVKSCPRQVLIGREVFLTMSSVIVTHNIGHSLLEGFENRFAPVVLEDRSQVGLGTVVYAGAAIGSGVDRRLEFVRRGSDPCRGQFAVGVPARAPGGSSQQVRATPARASCARRMSTTHGAARALRIRIRL